MIINRGFIIPAREFKIFVPEDGDTVYVGLPFLMEVSTVGLEDTTTVYMDSDPFNKILGQFTSVGGEGSGPVKIGWDYVDVASADIIENSEIIEIVGHNPRTLRVTDGVRVLTIELDIIGNKDFSMGYAEAEVKYLPDVVTPGDFDCGSAEVTLSAAVGDREHNQIVDFGTATAVVTYELKDFRTIFSYAKCAIKYLPDVTCEDVLDYGTAEVSIEATKGDRDKNDILNYGTAKVSLSDTKVCPLGFGDARATVVIHQ